LPNRPRFLTLRGRIEGISGEGNHPDAAPPELFASEQIKELDMRLLGKPWLPLAALLLVPALAVAGDPPVAKSPGVVVRVRSIDALFEVARYGAGLVGKGDIAEQLEQMVRNREDGIDLKKPIGFYAQVGKDLGDATAVLLLPVSGEKELLDALDGFGVKPQKGADGVYTVALPNVPVKTYFRFSNGYAYVTAMKKDASTRPGCRRPRRCSALSRTRWCQPPFGSIRSRRGSRGCCWTSST
jgi:hypothetical protein